jgi:hypothetical protein
VGKGSRRRIQQIADKQMQENWDTIFSLKPNPLVVDALNNLAESVDNERSVSKRFKNNSNQK